MNAYLNLTNINPALEIKKSGPKLDYANYGNLAKLGLILFLDLDNFTGEFIWDFAWPILLLLPTLLIVLLSSSDPKSFIADFTLMIFSIEINSLTI